MAPIGVASKGNTLAGPSVSENRDADKTTDSKRSLPVRRHGSESSARYPPNQQSGSVTAPPPRERSHVRGHL